MEDFFEIVTALLQDTEILPIIATWVGVLFAAWISDIVGRRWGTSMLKRLTEKTKNKWDDQLVANGIPTRILHAIPVLIIYASRSLLFPEQATWQGVTGRLMTAILVILGAWSLEGVINLISYQLKKIPMLKNKPLTSYAQLLKLGLFLIAGILVLSLVLNKSPWVFLSGVGALTAILLLVFKDTILGFVASIQIAANDLIKIGDWIEMPQAGADGDVLDITLTSIKIQNWDKTITTIPPYQLISQSFKNWKGMTESGGRRIKRSLLIDVTSIQFLTKNDLNTLQKIDLITGYLDQKKTDIQASKETKNKNIGSQSDAINNRQLTNIGTFRAYIDAYLKSLEMIHKTQMTFLVRQLPPSDKGIPLQLYVFSKETHWVAFEGIQSDIFDHLLAIMPEFGLRLFQNPTGKDFQAALNN